MRPEPPDVDAELRAYTATSLPTVLSPGADQARRTAYRRMRRRSTALAAFSVLALAGATAVVLHGRGAAGLAVASQSTAASPLSAASATPSAPGAPTPSSGTAPASPTTDPSRPPTSGSAVYDLVVSGPPAITLTPSNGIYVGTVHLVGRNVGRLPYAWTSVSYELPAGVSVVFDGGTNFGGCLASCAGPAIPAAGGTIEYAIRLQASYAPQPQARTIGDLVFEADAVDSRSDPLPEATPANNRVKVSLVLGAS